MTRRLLIAISLLVAASAIPASAGVVTIGTFAAAQSNCAYFSASVQASSTDLIGTNVLLTVDSAGGPVVIQPDRIDRTALDGQGLYVLFTIVKYAVGVVQPGDTLSVVVADAAGDTNTPRVAQCTAGSKKKRGSLTAVCQ